LKYYDAGNPTGWPGISTGWYVERGVPSDEGSYKLVFTLEGGTRVPLRLCSGDILDTAEGEKKTKFELRHKSFVVIEGREISTWGGWHKKPRIDQEQLPGIQKDLLYLVPIFGDSPKILADRRIVIAVWRFDYPISANAGVEMPQQSQLATE